MSIAKEIWQDVLPVLEVELNTLNFDLWIKPLEPLDVEDNKLILRVPTETNRDFINGSLRPVIERVLASVNPLYREITLLLQSEIESMGGNLAEIIEEEKKEEEDTQPKVMDAMLFNSRYTFDNFVVGECNRLAVAAARAVAENPGENYNPLFIYGGSGLGKTHIMHAIGNYIRKNNRKMKVLYVSSEKFVNDLVLSINNKSGSTVDFRDKYRSVDVLMIDDIQQIAGKEKTQIELFNTFNDLYQMNKHIIFASDRAPKDIPDIDDRLRTRFEWGFPVDVQSPDLETRIAILRKKAQMKKYNVPLEVLEYMAKRIDSNIREMESSLEKVVLTSKLYNKPITIELAADACRDYAKNETEAITEDDVIETTLKFFPKVTRDDLFAKRRTKEIVTPRMICMYLMIEQLAMSTTAIGKIFGGRDHTTVINARDKIAGELEKGNEQYVGVINDIKDMLYKN